MRALDAVEARADRTLAALDRRSPRAAAPATISARRRRLGLVEDRREPSVHDRLRAVRPARGEGARAQRRATDRFANGLGRWRGSIASTRALCRTSRRTWPTCCSRAAAAGRRASDRVPAPDLERGAALDELWARARRMYAVRPRTAAADAGRGEGRARRTSLRRRFWPRSRRPATSRGGSVDHDPLLEDCADTSVEATALGGAGAGARAIRRSRCSSGPSGGCC